MALLGGSGSTQCSPRFGRLGELRAKLCMVAGTLFPNLGIVPALFSLRVWHPRGPGLTDIWSYCLVPAAAPDDIKAAMVGMYQRGLRSRRARGN